MTVETKPATPAPDDKTKVEPTQAPAKVVTQDTELSTDAPEPTADAVTLLAQELGWNPDFTGDGAVDARTYILRGRQINDNLSKRVRSMNRELAAMKDGIETIKWSVEQSGKKEIARLKSEIAELKSKRAAAIRDGQVDEVTQFDNRIEALQDATRTMDVKPQPTGQPTANPPEYEDWVEQNRWYETDRDLQKYANNLSHMPEYQAMPYTMRLEQVGQKVRQMFPDKFKTSKTTQAADSTKPAAAPAPAAVAPVSPSRQRAAPSTRKATAADLSYEERQAGSKFVNMGIFKTLDEYAIELQKREQALAARGR